MLKHQLKRSPTSLCVPRDLSVSSGRSEPRRPSSCHPTFGKTQRKIPAVVPGRHAVASPTDTSRLDQARALFGLANPQQGRPVATDQSRQRRPGAARPDLTEGLLIESLYDFLAAVQARKAALGWIDTPSARKPFATKATLARPRSASYCRPAPTAPAPAPPESIRYLPTSSGQ